VTTDLKKQSGLQVLSTGADLESWRRDILGKRESQETRETQVAYGKNAGAGVVIGFVPTMGALHKGHLKLIEQARSECTHVVVSIFVNPLQFAPNEDFAKYPRTFESDRAICEAAGVDVIFHPTVDVMYPGGQEGTTRVVPPAVLEQSLYGQFRPPFFSGVATVVTRLFNLVQPYVAYFGEKDYQQLIVIKKMVFDLHMPVKVVGVETVREENGLAYSSRNVFLDAQQKVDAPILQKTLQEIKNKSLETPEKLSEFLEEGKKRLSAIPNVDLKYLVACDAESLTELDELKLPMVLLVAARFREIWLIDTLVVRSK
jgi:pantoate--beta-alanine ligase